MTTVRPFTPSRPRRPRPRPLSAAASCLALLAVLVGAPVVLAVVAGWPLPEAMPAGDELRRGLTSPLDPATVVKIVACLGWLLWLDFGYAVATETRDALSGRVRTGRPRRVIAHRLVNAALIVATTAPAARASAAAPATAAAPAVVAHARPDRAAADVRHDETVRPVYRVQPGDTVGRIAERLYGDPLEARNIDKLNDDRVMSDGRTYHRGAQIHPGWTLLLPREPYPEITVADGDDLWRIAKTEVAKALRRPPADQETARYWRRLIAANRARVRDPDVIHPNQRLLVPPIPPTPPAVKPVLPRPATGDAPTLDECPPAAASVPRGSPTASPPKPSESSEKSGPPDRPVSVAPRPPSPVPPPDGLQHPAAPRPAPAKPTGLLGVAAVGLAVAVSYSLARRRRRQLDRLPAGVRPAPPPAELTPLRAQLAADDDAAHGRALRAALGEIAAELATRPATRARPRLVQTTCQRIEVLLCAAALPPPPGWQSDADGTVWTRDLAGLADTSPAAGSAAPGLVTLGAPEPSGQVYLDLEAEGVTGLVGDPAACAGYVRSLVRELGHARYIGPLSVVVVGDIGDPALPAVDRVRAVTTWDHIAADALAWAEQSRAVVTAHGDAHPFTARARTDDEGLAPLVLVCADRPRSESFERLCTLVAEGNTTVTVLVVGDAPSGATRIELDGDLLRLPSLGLTCRAQTISAATSQQIAALLDHADRTTPEPLAEPTAPPALAATPIDVEPLPDAEPAAPPDYEVLVRLLGPITVEGAAKPLTPQQAAVVAYIALHQPVGADTLEDAVWSQPTASRRRRRINTVSECRSVLGPQHFPIAAGGRYVLGPLVRTDLDLFDFHVTRADRQPAKQAIGTLRAALDLVTGPVFTYRNADRSSYVWVDLEYLPANTETRITDAALRLAELCQDAGDVDGAIWAAQRGLLASPTHAGLTETLMRTYADSGQRGAAEHVYQSHRAALEDLDLDDVADSTAELHDRIRRSARAS